MIYYNIAKEFTETPGGRYRRHGPYSGEEFREAVLRELACESKLGEEIVIDFDGSYGYPIGFLDESFGVLLREIMANEHTGDDFEFHHVFQFKSNEDPALPDRIYSLVRGD